MIQNPVVIIAGPTASGKSALAIAVAKALNGAVVNCDALQIYKDIPVIAATPSEAEKNEVEHCLYELYDCSKRGNVVEWLDLCVAEIHRLWQEEKVPVVVGGTGMYIDALINGVTPIPEVPAQIRSQVQTRLAEEGLSALYAYLQQVDAEIAAKLSPNDKTRVQRAVEIFTATGKKVSDWYREPMIKKLPQAHFVVAKIVPSLQDIENRCRQRLDKMVYKLGALREIETLVQRGLADNLPAMKALGVPELSAFVRGETSLEDALELAKLHTRQYAKRQRTWLKNKLQADIVYESPYVGQQEYLERIIYAIKL